MQIYQGIGVSPGVAIGEALVIDNEGFSIPRQFVTRDAVDDELLRLERAFSAVSQEIERNRESVSRDLGEQVGAIFSAHLQMLHDPRFRGDVERLVREQHCSPEHAVSATLKHYADKLVESSSTYLAERAHDILDLERGLLRSLLGRRHEELVHISSPAVILAHNLTPSETANLDADYVLGFVTEIGGAGGHTAILAKGLEIPAVVGLGRFLTNIVGGDLVIIDGEAGRVIVQPDETTLASYRDAVEQHRAQAIQLQGLRDLPAQTQDGVTIRLLANIEFPHEAPACLERGADGIGLYRTEFLYIGADHEPSEEEHYQAYAQVVQAMAGRPVTIRTLDLGADKIHHSAIDSDDERNPFLGLRSIRLSLQHRDLFRLQLRAILRASALGHVRVMFPLITTLTELRRAKTLLAGAMEDLEEKGVALDHHIPVGIMVETPAAATLIHKFLREVNFISIGTNDLVQYTLAVDRSNPHVADLYRAGDPAVLQLIRHTISLARRRQKPTCLCGQMSAEPMYTMLLLGMGLREFSVPPSTVPRIKHLCRRVTISQCQAVAARVQRMDTAREVETYLCEELRKVPA
jgi:phosphotransferase system enzyme I (PtsI)